MLHYATQQRWQRWKTWGLWFAVGLAIALLIWPQVGRLDDTGYLRPVGLVSITGLL